MSGERLGALATIGQAPLETVATHDTVGNYMDACAGVERVEGSAEKTLEEWGIPRIDDERPFNSA